MDENEWVQVREVLFAPIKSAAKKHNTWRETKVELKLTDVDIDLDTFVDRFCEVTAKVRRLAKDFKTWFPTSEQVKAGDKSKQKRSTEWKGTPATKSQKSETNTVVLVFLLKIN